MITNIVAIPTRFEVDMIIDMYHTIKNEVDEWLIFDNGLPIEEYEKLTTIPVSILGAEDQTIYQMWNRSWKIAKTYYQFPNLFIVNDDVAMIPNTVTALATILRSTPDLGVICPNYTRPLSDGIGNNDIEYVTITHGQGGLAGFAFMLRAELDIQYIDEKFSWWYGDDDFLKQVNLAGYKAAMAKQIPIYHVGARSSSKLLEDGIGPKIEQDRLYFNAKYGENRTI